MKRMIAFLLALIMVLSIVACATKAEEPGAEAEKPAAEASTEKKQETTPDESVVPELTIAIIQHADDTIDTSLPWYTEMEAKLGMKINWIFMPDESSAEKVNALISSGDLPDLIMCSTATASLYGSEGVFEPLDDLIASSAPNLAKYMTKENTYSIRNSSDGFIYGIPQYIEMNTTTQGSMTYRKDILEKLGAKEPTTFEEWTDLYKQVKENYPELNVLCERYSAIESQMATQFGMGVLFGGFDTSNAAGYGLTVQGDRKTVEFLPTTENYKEMLKWYADLYANGILDEGYLTIDYTVWWDQNICGGKAFACNTQNFNRCFEGTSTAVANGLSEVNWWVAETPLNPINGERKILMKTSPWRDGYAWALSADSENKDAAMKFIDFWFSDEGILMYSYGLEGNTYKMVDGEPVRLPEGDIMANTLARFEEGFAFFMPSVETIAGGGYYSEPVMIDHFDKNSPYVESIPSVAINADDVAEMTDSQVELNAYVMEMRDKFITGRESFDNWDAFVNQCKALGCETNTKYVQGWLDAYYDFMG